MANNDNPNYTNKHNVTQKGDKFEVTVTRYFDDMERAVQWAESTYSNEPFQGVNDNNEPAASDMTPQDAEKLNANVNPAPIPAGAEQVISGGSAENTGEPKTEVVPAAPVTDNTAAGTFDPNSGSGQKPATEPSSKESNKN